MKRGDQIAYIPNHAKAQGITHPDIEFGFINSFSPVDSETIFCCYWIKGSPGCLRTVANSEATNIRDIKLHVSVKPWVVQEVIDIIDNQKEN